MADFETIHHGTKEVVMKLLIALIILEPHFKHKSTPVSETITYGDAEPSVWRNDG